LVLQANRQKDKSIVVGDRVQITIAEVRGDDVRPGIAAPVSEKIASLPKVRKEKVFAVRHQLAEGKYGINERLSVALDKVIEDLITKRVEENEEKSKTRNQQKQNENFSC